MASSWLADQTLKYIARFPVAFQESIKNFILRVAVDDVVLAQQSFLPESQLLQNATRGPVLVVYQRYQLAQSSFRENLSHQQLDRSRGYSLSLMLFGDAIADLGITHGMADILQGNASHNGSLE